MYSELEDIEEKRYINILRESKDYKLLLEYETCKAYFNNIFMAKISKVLANLIQNTKYDKVSRIIPILVSPEIENIQLFELLKTSTKDGKIVYVPSPPPSIDMYYHIYNCVIEEFGVPLLEEISRQLQTKEIRRNRCVRVITDYFHDKTKKDAVIRWFLGEELSPSDKTTLGFEESIRMDDNSLEMLKLVGNFSQEVLLLYIDDLESSYENIGELAEIKFLESIKRLHHDVKQLVIIIICSKNLWPKILQLADESFNSILGPELEFYTLSQLKEFIKKVMEEYWVKNRVSPPSNPYFPLNEPLINIIIQKIKGDLRKFFKLYQETISKIISS